MPFIKIWPQRAIGVVAGRAIMLAILAIGLGATLAVWIYTTRAVERRLDRNIAYNAEQFARVIEHRLEDSQFPIASMAAFVAARPDFDERDFAMMAEQANLYGIAAIRLSWAPRVARRDPAEGGAARRDDVPPDHGYWTIDSSGSIGAAPPAREHFPVQREMFAPGLQRGLGFDLRSAPDRRIQIERARQTRRPVAWVPSFVSQRMADTALVIIYWPIFADAAHPSDDSPDGLRGIVSAMFRLSDLVDYVGRGMPPLPGRLVLRIEEPGRDGADVAATFAGGGRPSLGQPREPLASPARRGFALLGLQWQVEYEPEPGRRNRWNTPIALYVFGLGGLATLALMGLVHFLLAQIALQKALAAASRRHADMLAARATEIENLKLQVQLQERRAAESVLHASDVEHQNEELRQEELAARQIATERTRVLASAGHDSRQPLQALMAHAGMIRATAQDEPTRRSAKAIIHVTESPKGMLGVFLDLHRLDAGRVEVRNGPVEIGKVLRGLCHEFRLTAQRPGVRLRLRTPECALWTDRAILEVVLRNLIGNAMKFTRTGSVLVAVRMRRDIQIEVWDTGPGIAASAQQRIFEEFAQASDDRSGAGLGLAIAQRMATLLGGRITLCSREGVGSRFTLVLSREDSGPMVWETPMAQFESK